jgi:hypothetical protein
VPVNNGAVPPEHDVRDDAENSLRLFGNTDPDAARDNLGELFVRSPWGAVADLVDEQANDLSTRGDG